MCKLFGGVMVSVLASSAVDHELEPRSVQIKDYKIGICCFSAKHAALRDRAKTGWLGIMIMCLSVDRCLTELKAVLEMKI